MAVLKSLRRKVPDAVNLWFTPNVLRQNYTSDCCAVGSKWNYRYKKIYQGATTAIIFDWGGTIVDCGVLAPLLTFVKLFKDEGVDITEDEARRPMGSHKRVHIQTITEMDTVKKRWLEVKGSPPTQGDVQRMYDKFVPTIMTCISETSAPVTGLKDTASTLREKMNLKIGSTTGYPSQVLDVLLKMTAAHGFSPDASVAADQVPEARPCPYMVWQCAMRLGVHPIQSIIKVDDTVDGIGEGLSAGCWTVGVTRTGNYVGLTEEQLRATDPSDLRRRMRDAYGKLSSAGAHYVIDDIRHLPEIVCDINKRLASAEIP